MNDLAEFLLARIAEDEAVAREVEDHGRWSPMRDDDRLEWWVDADAMGSVAKTGYVGNTDSLPLAEHIARHDPVRVLAECEAKRRIVGLHRAEAFEDAPAEAFCTHDQRTSGLWPCPTMRLLALPHADHPDYREEWRP